MPPPRGRNPGPAAKWGWKPTQTGTDAELADRFLRDPQLFTEVHDRHFTAVHRYVAARLGTQAAEDVAAETFLVAFDRRASFDAERGDLRVWLFGIATNLVSRHRRKEARHYRALARLEVAPAVEGPENRVVAALDISSGTVGSRLTRARTKLKELSGPRAHAYSLFAVDVTLEQLRALPTDPAALRAWIEEALEHSDARSSKGPFDAEDRKMATFYSLISLVSTVPAPPDVRAAAFRALAAYPDVESLGEVPGGQGLLLPGDVRLVVDPATGRVNGSSMYVTADGAIYSLPDGDGARIGAQWTDTPPA